MINKNIFYEYGYDITPNFLPQDLYNDIVDAINSTPFKTINQQRPGRYALWDMDSRYWPDEDEDYLGCFKSCSQLLFNRFVKRFTKNHIEPLLSKTFPEVQYVRHQVTSMTPEENGHLRCHYDDYTSHIGYIFYAIDRDWKYDWGGLLHISKNNNIETIIPTPNTLVVIDHKNKLPHWVTPVNSWAKTNRNTITGFTTTLDQQDWPETWKSKEFYNINKI